MNVLDIDLDFFIHGERVTGPEKNTRPNSENRNPWSSDEIDTFLQKNLNLNISTPCNGSIVKDHHEVFYAWRKLISENRLKTPFFIAHVDAHSDFGMRYPIGDSLQRMLKLELKARQYPQDGDDGLNCGSYMIFALACRWFKNIDFIAANSWKDDLPINDLLYDSSLCRNPTTEMDDLLKAGMDIELELKRDTEDGYVSCGEPKIRMPIIATKDIKNRYKNIKWDYIFLAKSPEYVIEAGDGLISIIGKYIQPL